MNNIQMTIVEMNRKAIERSEIDAEVMGSEVGKCWFCTIPGTGRLIITPEAPTSFWSTR